MKYWGFGAYRNVQVSGRVFSGLGRQGVQPIPSDAYVNGQPE